MQRALALGAGLASIPKALAQSGSQSANLIREQHFARGSQGVNVAVQTPDVPDLPFTLDNGVKVFHLIAEPVKQQIVPNKVLSLWGYNGSAPGPTIQINQGDRVRIIVDNHLPEPTSMHWHGFEIPFNMDGACAAGRYFWK